MLGDMSFATVLMLEDSQKKAKNKKTHEHPIVRALTPTASEEKKPAVSINADDKSFIAAAKKQRNYGSCETFYSSSTTHVLATLLANHLRDATAVSEERKHLKPAETKEELSTMKTTYANQQKLLNIIKRMWNEISQRDEYTDQKKREKLNSTLGTTTSELRSWAASQYYYYDDFDPSKLALRATK